MSNLPGFFNYKVLLVLLGIFIVFFFSIYVFEVVKLFIIAFIIVYITNPIKLYFDKYINKTFASLLSIIIFILLLLSIFILIVPIILEQTQNLILILPSYISNFENFIREMNSKYLFYDQFKSLDISILFKPLSNTFLKSGNELIKNSVEFFNSFFNIILILVISFYMSLEFEKIKSFFDDLASKSNFKDFKKLTDEIDVVLSKFIRGQSLICTILATFYAITLFLVGIKFGILLGIFSGLISFVPYIGAFLGGGLTLILGLFQFGISIEILVILSIFLAGQLLESYYLTPKFVGNAINLNPIWIMFALLTGAYLAGFVGVLISLPIAAICGVLLRYYMAKLF